MKNESGLAAFFRDAEVLVSGGYGFIGSHIVASLVELGARPTVVDLDCSPRRDSLVNQRPGLRESIRSVQGDLADKELVQALIRGTRFRSIFNCASYASVIERAVDFPYETIQTNTLGVVNLLEALRTGEHPLRSFVHTSTDKVYGDSGGEVYDEESTPLRATGVYDVSKLAADAFCRMYHSVYGLPTVVLRLCNIIGPGDFNTAYRVVPKAMRNLLSGPRPVAPQLYSGSVHHERDYIYVGDCVRALLGLAATPACHGKVYNLEGRVHLKTPEILAAVVSGAAEAIRERDPDRAREIEATGYEIVQEPTAKVITIPTQRASGARLREDLGFEPRVSLSEGLRESALAYYAYYHPS